MQPLSSSRTRDRTPVLMTATLLTPDGAHRVLIRDISPTGAQIIAEGPLPDHCDALFKRGALFAAAHVVWTRGNDAEIGFYRELSIQEVDSTFHPVVPRAGS